MREQGVKDEPRRRVVARRKRRRSFEEKNKNSGEGEQKLRARTMNNIIFKMCLKDKKADASSRRTKLSNKK